MLTGRNFLLIALVVGVCAMTTTGCKRRSSGDNTTVTQTGVFTTDNFPGADVQEGNVSDDKRAFSTWSDSYNGGSLVCTHNGDRGTIMVTYQCDDQVFAHYFDGSTWNQGVTLRHFDTLTGTVDAGEIVHAFINTGSDDRPDAADRDGDCLIFWNARDFDSDGAGVDDENQCEYASYFDVSHSGDASLNFGFDIDPLNPGFFDAQRISSLEFSGEDVSFQGLVTDGLCGEARWQDGANVYSYGNNTSAIFVFWHQVEEKSLGVFDQITVTAGYNLASGVDEEFALVPTPDVEVGISGFGASDSGATSRETAVGSEYSSYNFILTYRVESLVGASFGSVTSYYFNVFPGADADVTLQSTFFDPTSLTLTNDVLNSYLPNSGITSIDEINCDFSRDLTAGFLGSTGLTTFGSDEGLSCYVTWFGETRDADNTDGFAYGSGEGNEAHIIIAEISEVTGAYLNGSENPVVDFNDPTVVDNVNYGSLQAQISRNGDYIWVAYFKLNSSGAGDDFDPELVQYQTTRLDGDGLPVPVLALASSLGVPHISDVEDTGFFFQWGMFQDNLGYICGQQSDPRIMTFYFYKQDVGTGDDEIWERTLTSDVDGVLGGETVSAPSLLISEDVSFFHFGNAGMNVSRATFNATDAGQDGDILYMFTFDDFDTNGLSDVFIRVGRFGLSASAPIELGSGTSTRQAQYNGDRLTMVSTPPGSDIGQFDLVDGYPGEASHGPSEIHLIFREAETASYPISTGGNTETGYALRTRQYITDGSAGAFGDDFIPNAGTTFEKPFDLDLPFMDPDTFDDAEVMDIEVCDSSTVLIFEENGHLYFQEWAGNGNGGVGWRTSAEGVSDPALIDDDTAELVLYFEQACAKECTCCQIDGTALFWVKELDVNTSIDRLQVRIIDRGGDH